MATAYASLETATRALNEGAEAYVIKPLSVDEVLVTIGKVLDKQRLIRENKRLYQATQQELADRMWAEDELKRAKSELAQAFVEGAKWREITAETPSAYVGDGK